jgi:hypothetical protein
MVRAFRRWSVAHPAEFGLIFGNPVPGVATCEDECLGPEHAGARFGATFLVVFAELWPVAQWPTPPEEVITARLGPILQPQHAATGVDLPVSAVYAYLSAWIRLYGLVAMEVFGHLQWAVTEVEPLFELELASFLAQLRAEVPR